MKSMKIGCVIVLYNPVVDIIGAVILSVVDQVDYVCLVDNSLKSSFDSDVISNSSKIHYIPLGQNRGIAAAQNIGINFFIEKGYTHVFLLDQDTIVPNGVVDRLASSFELLSRQNYRISAIGANAINRQNGKSYGLKSSVEEIINDNLIEVKAIRATTSLIPIENFKTVGYLNETLFIDGVDHEWCWRAFNREKLKSFVVEDLFVSHQRGEGDKNFLGFEIAIPTPFRTYYQFRNYIYLSRLNYVPIEWKIVNGFKYSLKFIYYPIFVSPRLKYVRNILRGIKDGIMMRLSINENALL